ncbi:hypothetical protein QF002_002006 [Paraburkholderia youngii]
MSDFVVEQPTVVEADLNYLVADGVKPATYAYEPPRACRCAAASIGPNA